MRPKIDLDVLGPRRRRVVEAVHRANDDVADLRRSHHSQSPRLVGVRESYSITSWVCRKAEFFEIGGRRPPRLPQWEILLTHRNGFRHKPWITPLAGRLNRRLHRLQRNQRCCILVSWVYTQDVSFPPMAATSTRLSLRIPTPVKSRWQAEARASGSPSPTSSSGRSKGSVSPRSLRASSLSESRMLLSGKSLAPSPRSYRRWSKASWTRSCNPPFAPPCPSFFAASLRRCESASPGSSARPGF